MLREIRFTATIHKQRQPSAQVSSCYVQPVYTVHQSEPLRDKKSIDQRTKFETILLSLLADHPTALSHIVLQTVAKRHPVCVCNHGLIDLSSIIYGERERCVPVAPLKAC